MARPPRDYDDLLRSDSDDGGNAPHEGGETWAFEDLTHEAPAGLGALGRRLSDLASRPSTAVVLLVLLLNQLLFAVMHTFSHAALEHIPPLAFALFRFLFSLPFLWALARAERLSAKAQGLEVEVTPRVVAYTVGCGYVGVALAQTLVLLGNSLAGPSIAAITQPGIPAYTALIAATLGVERLAWGTMAGVLLAVAGSLVLLHVEHWGSRFAHLEATKTLGTFVMLAQTLSYSVFMVAFSSLLQWFPYPFTAFFLCTLWSCIWQMFVALPSLMSYPTWGPVPPSAWGAVAYCAIVVSFVAHTGQAWAIRHLRPTIPSLFVLLQPPLTIFMSVVFLDEKLELWTDLGGMALIVLGMVMVVFVKNHGLKDGKGAATAYGRLGEEDQGPCEDGVNSDDMEMLQLDGTGRLNHPRKHSPRIKQDPFDTSMCVVSSLRRLTSAGSESLLAEAGGVNTAPITPAATLI